jgi:DUF2075 family protein
VSARLEDLPAPPPGPVPMPAPTPQPLPVPLPMPAPGGPAPQPLLATLDELPDPGSDFVAQRRVSFWERPITAIAQGVGAATVDKPQGMLVSPQAVELLASRRRMPRALAAELLRGYGMQPDAGGQVLTPEQVDLIPGAPANVETLAALWQAAEATARGADTREREQRRLEAVPGVLRPLVGGARGAADSLASAALYAGSMLGGGDDTRAVLEQQVLQAQASQEGRDANLGTAGKLVDRAANNVLSMVATPGGAGAKITQAMLTQGGQAYADAIAQGLSEEEARAYAAKQAIAEAVPAAVMSAARVGGVEDVLGGSARRAVGATVRERGADTLRALGRTMAQEQPEEIVTTIAQQQLATEIDPQAMENQRLAAALGDTIAQTAVATGMTHLPQAISALFDSPGRPPLPSPPPTPTGPHGRREEPAPPAAPPTPEQARARTAADLEAAGFAPAPLGPSPEALAAAERARAAAPTPVAAPAPAAPAAADAQPQVSDDERIALASDYYYSDDPAVVRRAADAARQFGVDLRAARELLEAQPATTEAPASPNPPPSSPAPAPAARPAERREVSDLGSADEYQASQPVDVKVGRNVHRGVIRQVNPDGTLAVRLDSGREIQQLPAYRVIPVEPEQATTTPPPAPAGPQEAPSSAPGSDRLETTRAADPAPAATSTIDAAAAAANPEPTEAQKEAGNYAKGHVRLHGMNIAIENAKGSTRRGVDAKGTPWSVEMPAHYGYVKGTQGADGDHVDVYLGPAAETAGEVYVVDQIDAAKGTFDEHKAMVGFGSEAEALAAYDGAFSDGKGPERRGAVTAMPVEEFKRWASSREAKKPLRWTEATDAVTPAPAVQAPQAGGVPPVAERLEVRPDVAPGEPADGGEASARPADAPAVEAAPAPAPAAAAPEDAPAPVKPPRRARAKAAAPAAEAGITDFGEKIGGARKDTATRGEKRAAAPKPKDERPAWARRYEVAQIASSSTPGEAGRWAISDTKDTDWRGQPRRKGDTTFATKEEAEAAVPMMAVSRNHRVMPERGGGAGWAIVRVVSDTKRVTIKDGFADREAAMRYMAEHAREIIEQETGFGEEILARPERAIRTGPARRTADATAEDFKKAFGFRGVEFGNWNNQAERQEVMNHAYDGLMDLAEILDVPPSALSLNGELALAFGARGHGLQGARAHYERDYGVINLTKMAGAGSLAHEWWHGFDHYLGRQDGKSVATRVRNKRGDLVFAAKPGGGDYVSHGFSYRSQARPELVAAHQRLIETMLRKAERYVEDTAAAERFVGSARDRVDARLKEIRARIEKAREYGAKKAAATSEQLARFDQMAQRFLDGDAGEVQWKIDTGTAHGRWSNDSLEAMSALLKEVTGRQGFNAERTGLIDQLATSVRYLGERAKMLADARAENVKTKQTATNYLMESKKIDQGRASDYWTQPHEMAARAFSAYVEDKVAERGGASEFLSYGSDNRRPEYRLLNARPFPEGEERKAINQAFDQLVETIETRTTAKGTTELYATDTDAAEDSAEREAAFEDDAEDDGAAGDLAAPDLSARVSSSAALPKRIEPAPLEPFRGQKVEKLGDIILEFGKALSEAGVGKTEFTNAGLRADQKGVYKPSTGQTAIRHNNLDAAAHEIAHRLDDFFPFTTAPGEAASAAEKREWKRAIKELHWFSLFGSMPPEGLNRAQKQAYFRAEGFAEFVRAVIVNPDSARAVAPHAWEMLQARLPAPVWRAVVDYSQRVRRFRGLSPAERTQANVRGVAEAAGEAAKRGTTSKLRAALNEVIAWAAGRGTSSRKADIPDFQAGLLDRVKFGWFDSLWPAIKAYRQALSMRGIEQSRMPIDKDYETLARIGAGLADRMDSMFIDGLVSPENEPVVDPRTGERMSLEWLLEPATDAGLTSAEVAAELDAAMAQGVEERTLEEGRRNLDRAHREAEIYREQLREANPDDPEIFKKYFAFLKGRVREVRAQNAKLTGIAGGLDSDYEQARRAIRERKAGDPAVQARRDELLRRYRAWANATLDYCVAAGVMGKDHADNLKRTHQAYIDLHRVVDAETAALPIKAFKGSTRLIDNPLVNLMHATWSAIQWADRNRTRRAFVDALVDPRGLHEGAVKDLATIGYRISDEDVQNRDDTGKVNGRRPYKVWRPAKNEFGQDTVEPEWWVFDPAVEAGFEAGTAFDNPTAIEELLHAVKRMSQRMITSAPPFLIRQVFRDTVSRLVTTEVGSGIGDLFRGYGKIGGKPVTERYKTSGAGQAGWDEKGKEQYQRRLMGTLYDAVHDRNRVVATASSLGSFYMKAAGESDLVNRRAEFVRAWKEAKAKGLTDFQADLYAATHARRLMDFAIAGYYAKKINRFVVFFNAGMQAMRRFARAWSREHAATTAMRWGIFAAAPTALLYAAQAALMDDDERREWQQRPHEKRDFHWSFKLAPNLWLDIPKPYEWGVMASAIERLLDMAGGNENAWEGYGASVGQAMIPLKPDMMVGSMRPFLEVATNYSFFTGRNIVPQYEEGKDLDLRSGTENASALGQLLQQLIGMDARKIDHLITSLFGGYGRIAASRSTDPAWWAGATTGLAGRSPAWEAADVQWVLDRSEQRGVGSRKVFTILRQKLKAAGKAETAAERDRLAEEAREYATGLRKRMEAAPQAFGGP